MSGYSVEAVISIAMLCTSLLYTTTDSHCSRLYCSLSWSAPGAPHGVDRYRRTVAVDTMRLVLNHRFADFTWATACTDIWHY